MIGASVAPSAPAVAWRALEGQLRPFLARRLSQPSDVDDVLQETLLRVHTGLPTVRDEERFGPWVYRVARNALADHLRARARHPLAEGEPPELPAPAHDEAEVDALPALLATQMAPFVAMLPSPYREALTLTELQGMPQGEAAALLGVSVSAMKSRVQRGRARLRALLEACCAIGLDARGRVVACDPKGAPCVCD